VTVPLRRPAGLDYPRPEGLHIKLTSETYMRSLRCPLGAAPTLRTTQGTRPSRARERRVAPIVSPGPCLCQTSTASIGWVSGVRGQSRSRRLLRCHRRPGVPRRWWNLDQADGAEGNGRGSGHQSRRRSGPIGHERRYAVKHVLQACFELPFPEVLGQS